MLERGVAEHCATVGCQCPRALLLGVTPELAAMRWPSGTRLAAVDANPAMFHVFQPGNALAGSAMVCGDWTVLPFRSENCDVVVGDGLFVQLRYPQRFCAVIVEVHRVLLRTGLFATRVLLRPDVAETVGTVLDELQAGRIGNFHVFKLRLSMALHSDLATGVRLADVWQVWHDAFPQPQALARELNWPLETIGTIDAYRGLDTRYAFPTHAEFRQAVAGRFAETACVLPDYELGELCPTFLLRSK